MAVWVVSDKKLSRIIKSSVAINRVYIYIKINLPGQIKYVERMNMTGYHFFPNLADSLIIRKIEYV